jgi:purine-binding chemotaxis protein CheW
MDAVIERPNAATDSSSPRSRAAGGKYLTFRLGEEEFGVLITRVRELIGIMEITRVPQTHDYVEGVINLRGKVIPVIDLRAKFGLPRADYNDQTCIIVVDVGVMMGIIVDTVEEVHDIASADIEPAPVVGEGAETAFMLGMGKVRDQVKILLDIDHVLTGQDLVAS